MNYMIDRIKELARHISWPTALRVIASFGCVLLISIGFVALADEVHEGDTLAFDQAVLQAIHARSSDFWNSFFLVATEFGGVIGVAAIAIAFTAWFLFKKHYKRALVIILGVGGAALLNLFLKFIFERPRPDLWEQLIIETSFSFPSGHAMASAALACCVIVLFWNTRWRLLATSLAVLYVVLIGFSRLYLGVHYPTDVIAGWLVSGAWVAIIVSILYGRRIIHNSLLNRNAAS
jgi:membrane-associated phospholipid phosphatase